MATYYVRKTGDDANGGTDPDTDAVLTIGKGEDLATTAGDTVYVGAGVYRELVTNGYSGSSGGGNISFIADVDGSQTGDAGLVIVTAYDAETSASARAGAWSLNGKTFVTVQGFALIGGSTAAIYDTAGNSTGEGVIIDTCSLIGKGGSDGSVWWSWGTAASPTADGLIVRNCALNGVFYNSTSLNASADTDRKMRMENCIRWGNGQLSTATYSTMFMVDQTGGAGSFGQTGFTVRNCTSYGALYGVYADAAQVTAAVTVENCLIIGASVALTDSDAGNADAITSVGNHLIGCSTDYTNVTAGTNDVTTGDTGLIGGIGDHPLYATLGWSPFRPGEPIRTQDDAYTHVAIGGADTAATIPTTDLYGNPRPMHGTVEDAGAVEGRARPEKETTTVRTGSNAIRFEGAGFHDFFVPVAAQSTTITIYGRYDSSYTGSLPKLEVLNIPGVADKSDTMVAAANTWEQLSSAAFTPTAAGVCRVRISSQDTSASGESFFDDLVVT